MGERAAKILVGRIENDEAYVPEIAVKPEFVLRHSTTRAHVLLPGKRRYPDVNSSELVAACSLIVVPLTRDSIDISARH